MQTRALRTERGGGEEGVLAIALLRCRWEGSAVHDCRRRPVMTWVGDWLGSKLAADPMRGSSRQKWLEQDADLYCWVEDTPHVIDVH